MRPIPIVLVGALGYGAYYRRLLSTCVPQDRFLLAGIVDPTVSEVEDTLPYRVPLYQSLEEFYAERDAELAIVSSPITFHYRQCLTALRHGSHVLCEKPLVPTVGEARTLQQAAEAAGRYLGVGFQWSFCTPVLTLKRDIIGGVFGKPLTLSTLISWKRYDRYYQTSPWKGRIHGRDGELILDSVATNATAHYLHNLFFLMGDRLSSSKLPEWVKAAIYRAKEIESFDTCFLRGRFAGGTTFYYAATHSGDEEIQPCFTCRFENAVVEMTDNGREPPHILATFRDGRTVDYGNPQSDESSAEKILRMLELIQNGGELPCGTDTVLPHMAVCSGLFQAMPVYDFPPELRYREEDPAGTFVRGLTRDCLRCAGEGLLPSEAGLSWAQPETAFTPETYV